jgi:hypothetical protein
MDIIKKISKIYLAFFCPIFFMLGYAYSFSEQNYKKYYIWFSHALFLDFFSGNKLLDYIEDQTDKNFQIIPNNITKMYIQYDDLDIVKKYEIDKIDKSNRDNNYKKYKKDSLLYKNNNETFIEKYILNLIMPCVPPFYLGFYFGADTNVKKFLKSKFNIYNHSYKCWALNRALFAKY